LDSEVPEVSELDDWAEPLADSLAPSEPPALLDADELSPVNEALPEEVSSSAFVYAVDFSYELLELPE